MTKVKKIGTKVEPRNVVHCNGGDTFDVQQPDASCTNWIKFTSTVDGQEFEYESKATGVYQMNFEGASELFNVTFRSTCVNFDEEAKTRIEEGGKLLRLEDQDDNDFTDLIIRCAEGVFEGEYNKFVKTLTYRAGAGADCQEGFECIDGVCTASAPPPPIYVDPPVADPPEGANGNKGTCPPGGPSGGSGCGTTTVLSRWTGYYTHSWDRSKIRSVSVMGSAPDGHYLRVEFNPHMCDMDTLESSACLCTSTTAYGNPITEFTSVSVVRSGEYVLDVTVRGKVAEVKGQNGTSKQSKQEIILNECPSGTTLVGGTCEWVPVEKNIIPECVNFACCPTSACEDGSPEGNIDIGDGDGDGIGDCDKRPTPNPVPGSNDKNQVYLYDKLNHTFVFCCPIHADVTWLLPYDTMPSPFQRYVSAAASVRAAAQLIDNPQLFQLLKDRENTLRMTCMNYELEQGDYNYLNQPDHSTYMSYQTMQTLNR